jgi:hypothetical protein
MKKKIKIFLGVLILLIGLRLYSSSEIHFPLSPYIDTVFADNFSWEKFDKVKEGMTQEQVKSILGEPLDRSNYGINNPDGICWRYSKDGKLSPFADFSYYLVQVCFKDQVVESKPVTELGE